MMKKFLDICGFVLIFSCISATLQGKQNWGETPYNQVATGPFSGIFVIQDKIEERKHYLKFVAIYKDKIGVYMAKEIDVIPKNGKTRAVPWIDDPELQSGSHTTFSDLGEKILVTQGELLSIEENGHFLTMKIPFADKDIKYFVQQVYLGDRKK
ncbi:hypothetical protein [Rubellicoccus peritrichatus]|uniref:Uncharacterized protein n=1 Tax=Rubellicoccus peritrichatus TaxID=3080537 RepID=A0AAQ3QT86_9BACT|nr:hypothetical protein [Puniceicoccus sp. CR14]WOO43433.1 hypothetical protein RZN69_10060 [Puniceicoccus sp. CR14]